MELAIDSSTVDVARRAQDDGHMIGFLKPMPSVLADATRPKGTQTHFTPP